MRFAQKNLNDGTKLYVHGDHLGSTSTITDASGNAVENSSYTPFGEILTGGSKSRYSYTGQEFDTLIGDYDYNARRYKAEWGLFVQPDTIIIDLYHPKNLNRYSYVVNNPYRYKDSSGRYEEDVHRDLTGYLANLAGYSSDEANRIADVDQATDENPSTSPYNIFSDAPKEYHFQSREVAEERIRQAIESGDLKALGMSLHTYQDTYSHEGYDFNIWKGQFGHAKAGHAPDKTYNNPVKADWMAFGVFAQFGEAKGMNAGQIINSWRAAQTTIYLFNRAQTREEKQRILGTKITYSGGTYGGGTIGSISMSKAFAAKLAATTGATSSSST